MWDVNLVALQRGKSMPIAKSPLWQRREQKAENYWKATSRTGYEIGVRREHISWVVRHQTARRIIDSGAWSAVAGTAFFNAWLHRP